jgi:hypothetical protein
MCYKGKKYVVFQLFSDVLAGNMEYKFTWYSYMYMIFGVSQCGKHCYTQFYVECYPEQQYSDYKAFLILHQIMLENGQWILLIVLISAACNFNAQTQTTKTVY